jgi:hypothetical protein
MALNRMLACKKAWTCLKPIFWNIKKNKQAKVVTCEKVIRSICVLAEWIKRARIKYRIMSGK